MKKLFTVLSILLICLSLTGCKKDERIHVGIIQIAQFEALDNASQGFIDALKEEFGDNIVIDLKNASGDSTNCATIASSFVAEGVDLIMANATPSLIAAANATANIPILGTSVTEYSVALGLDNFNGIVGGNISGTSDLASLDNQAQMILDLFPDTKKVGLIYCSAEPNSLYQVKVVKEYLESKGIEAKSYPFADSNDIASIAQSACEENDVIYVPTDNTAAANGSKIGEYALSSNTPVICGEIGTCIPCGGVATFTIDYYELGYTTGQMAIKILKDHADISKMPIEYYANPKKMYDKELALKYGINIPSDYVEIEK